MIVIGIDPGVSGGYSAIFAKSEEIVCMHKFQGWLHFAIFLKRFPEYKRKEMIVITEQVQAMSGDDAHTATVLNQNAGGYYTLMDILLSKGIKTYFVPPQKWQKAIFNPNHEGTTKERAYKIAHKIWPLEKFLATPLSRVPDHNLVDATLIALYGARTFIK